MSDEKTKTLTVMARQIIDKFLDIVMEIVWEIVSAMFVGIIFTIGLMLLFWGLAIVAMNTMDVYTQLFARF